VPRWLNISGLNRYILDMKPRTRTVPSAKQVLQARFPKLDVGCVFPLSPSSLTWGLQKGCTLQRALGKGTSVSVRPNKYVFRGSLIDHAHQRYLVALQRGEHIEEEELLEALYEEYTASRADYEPTPQGWVDEVAGLLLELVRQHPDIRPASVQQEHYLYIGDSMEAPDFPRERPVGLGARDWVYGLSDWTEEKPGGREVWDLKVLAKPLKDVGRYRLQLYTYAAALWQAGHDVKGVALCQFHWKSKRIREVSENFTLRDYDRVIQIYRQARDHYLSVIEGKADFIIPYRATGKCSAYDCMSYHQCPLGGGR
jgi:hypothetical protein